jgi:GH25 family lysozyme M1 (1,4-beta-N-acetylmuramidase)
MKFIRGIDLSIWSGSVDFNKALAQGIAFEYTKGSQGLFTDKTFLPNHTNAKGKMKRGIYHFLDFRVDGDKQGYYFWNLVKNDIGELPLCIDWEWMSGIPTPSNAFRMLHDCLEAIIKESGLERSDLAIYTHINFWKEAYSICRIEDITLARNTGYWKQFKLWQTFPYGYEPTDHGIWEDYFIWQDSYKGDGRLHGTSSNAVDTNLMREETWYDYFNEKPEVPVEPPVEETKDEEMKFEVVVKELRVRSSPSTYGKIIRTIPLGTQVTVYDIDGVSGAWIKISPDLQEWVCVTNSYGRYMRKVD